jgi:endoglucanase
MQTHTTPPRRPLGRHILSFVAACVTAVAGLLSHGSAAAYTAQAGKILDAGGNAVTLRGVNWFGFETANHIPHGLWTRNWRSMIEQMKSLGFNAVRLPFCPDTCAARRSARSTTHRTRS